MLKKMSTIKKIIFGVLMTYMIFGLSFFFLYACSGISFVTKFIYAMNWDLTFFNDGLIGPVILFIPEAFVITAIVWLFYRKETTQLLRGLITSIPLWQIISFFCGAYLNDYTTPKTAKLLIILIIAGFILIYYFLFRELQKIFRRRDKHV